MRGSAECIHGVHEVAGSNPAVPTFELLALDAAQPRSANQIGAFSVAASCADVGNYPRVWTPEWV